MQKRRKVCDGSPTPRKELPGEMETKDRGRNRKNCRDQSSDPFRAKRKRVVVGEGLKGEVKVR